MQKLRGARVALYRSRRGISNEPRNVTIYLLRTLRGDNLEEIGRDFNISRFSSVRSVVEGMRRKISNPRASPVMYGRGINPNVANGGQGIDN